MRVEPLEAGRWSQCTESPSMVRWSSPSSAHGNEANQNQWMCGRVACSAAAKAQTEATYTCDTKGHSGCHVGDHDLHCLEWRVVPRGEKHPTWVGFDEEGPHTKRQARRRKGRARGRAKRTDSSGRTRGVRLCFLRSTLWQSQPESWKKVFWAPFQEDSIPGLEPKVQRLAR